jgi:hypothetical protein
MTAGAQTNSTQAARPISESFDPSTPESDGLIELPAPTAWPMVTAFGITLMAAGLVTHPAISVVGLAVALRAAVGWFREDLPVDHVEPVVIGSVEEHAKIISATSRTVEHLKAGHGSHRVRIPVEVHPYSSGLIGGLVGGVAMAICACAYGLIAHGSIWYPINLLAGVAMPSLGRASADELNSFNGMAFTVGFISHVLISALVGLLFAVLLPMLPSRRAAFWGSLISPLMWTALVWATLRLINQHGTGGPKAGSVVDPSFLTLVSDQSLRTTVVVGRQDLGKPDWRSYLPGHPMSPDEISDVVAWISAQRPKSQGTGGPAHNGQGVVGPQPKPGEPTSAAASQPATVRR